MSAGTGTAEMSTEPSAAQNTRQYHVRFQGFLFFAIVITLFVLFFRAPLLRAVYSNRGQIYYVKYQVDSSNKLHEVNERLLQDYDMLVFDSPPAFAVTGPIVLSQVLDGVCCWWWMRVRPGAGVQVNLAGTGLGSY